METDTSAVAAEQAQVDSWSTAETAAEPEIVDGDVVREIEPPPVIDVEDLAAPAEPAPRRPRPRARRATGEGRPARKTQAAKSSSKPRTPRAHTRSKEPVVG
jgi:hypothetical protein